MIDQLLAKIGLVRVKKSSQYLIFKKRNIETGAHYASSQCLLLGIAHIREHRMSYPIGLTPEQWYDEVLPDIEWFLKKTSGEDLGIVEEYEQERFAHAKQMLGEYYTNIWC